MELRCPKRPCRKRAASPSATRPRTAFSGLWEIDRASKINVLQRAAPSSYDDAATTINK